MSLKVLMLSIDDQGLLGEQKALRQAQGKLVGDTVDRHRRYGALVEKLNIVVTSKPGYRHERLSDKVDVYPTNARTLLGHLLAVWRYAESFVKHEGVDLVVAQDLTAPAAWLIKKIFKIPYIVSFHGVDLASPEWQIKLTDKILMPLVKFSVKRADGLRVVSPAIKKYFASLGVKCPIKVIPTPSDYKIFSEPQVEKVKQIREKYQNRFILLTDGRLESVKNYPLLFKTIKLLKEKIRREDVNFLGRESLHLNKANLLHPGPITIFKLLIIGSGSQEVKLKQLARQMGLDDFIEFLGTISFRDLVPYYQAGDVFVLASDSESLGKVLLQAGAAGKAAVTTKTLGAESIIKDGQTGFLVKVGDAAGLTDRIIELLTDSDLRLRLGQVAQKLVLQNYDLEANTRRLINFWLEIKNRSATID